MLIKGTVKKKRERENNCQEIKMRGACDQSGRDRSSSRHSETQAGFKIVGVKQRPRERKTSTSSHISTTDGRQSKRIITALNPQSPSEGMNKKEKKSRSGRSQISRLMRKKCQDDKALKCVRNDVHAKKKGGKCREESGGNECEVMWFPIRLCC